MPLAEGIECSEPQGVCVEIQHLGWWFASRRRITGENKRRFVSLEQDFDLDLVYITSWSLVLSPKTGEKPWKVESLQKVEGEVLERYFLMLDSYVTWSICYVQDWELTTDFDVLCLNLRSSMTALRIWFVFYAFSLCWTFDEIAHLEAHFAIRFWDYTWRTETSIQLFPWC